VRCSDVPFRRMPWYHVPTGSFWRFAAHTLRSRRAPRSLMIFNSTGWGATDAQAEAACRAYASAIGDFFVAHGFEVGYATAEMDEARTVELLLGSSALVAGMASSFSFLPGVALAARGDLYVTPLFYTEGAALHAWYDKQRAKKRLPANSTVPGIGVELAPSAQAAMHGELPQRVPWSMHARPPLLHAEVEDYVRLLHGYASEQLGLAPRAKM